MRLSISNIAWDPSEDEAVAELLGRHGVDAIDVAPAKYVPDMKNIDDMAVSNVRQWWADRGIEIVGMQALLFGTKGLNVFGTRETQTEMLGHLGNVCRIGRLLGARKLVFGSPKNRDRSGLGDDETRLLAADFFWRLGGIARSYGTEICLEPNPPCYGANFMCTSEETAAVVSLVGHRSIRMQLDTGACAINKEDVSAVVNKHARLIGHVHASEPDLLPLGDGNADHEQAGVAIRERLADNVVTIEMLATKSEPHLQSIERALRVAVARYVLNK